ncbi:uncharacterized protein ACJ7VT_006246 isoform 3-T3 [Polymixia lowei]
MSWFQSLRDDFTLRPFEIQQTSSDSGAMASGPPDVMSNQEPAEVVEECSGKKKSKFQTFKNFFVRKKRKEASASGGEAGLKASQSSDNVNNASENNTLTRSENDKGSGSKISLGSKALSHDSIFVSDSLEATEALGASQDSIHGKVKSLQLKQAIRLGSPPSLMCVKRAEDAGTTSEDDGLPCSPPEYSTLHAVLNQAQRNSSLSLEGTDSDDDQLSCATSSRAVSPLVAVPGDFSQPASPFGCLDNSAAKHKLGLRYKACNKRKPATRVEFRAEGDLSTSTSEPQEEEQGSRDVSSDQLRPTEEEGEEETDQPQHSKQSLLRDKEEEEEEEGEEGEDELGAGQDVSHAPEASSPLLCNREQQLPEEEAPDAQPLASSEPGSRASSLGRTRVTPEPPAGHIEYLLDPPGTAYGRAESGVELHLEEGEDAVLSNIGELGGGESGEEESSFLQEVLSSLKTPLNSCSLGLESDNVVLEVEEEMKEEAEEAEEAKEMEEGEEGEVETERDEVKEEETEVDEPVSHQAPPSASMAQEEEEEVVALGRTAPSCQAVEEEEDDDNEKEDEEVVEQSRQHTDEEEGEEVQEVRLENCAAGEEMNASTGENSRREKQEGDGESEGEQEVIELEEEPEEEGQQKKEEEEEEELREEGRERVEEGEEEEEEMTEEITEAVSDATDETARTAAPGQEEDEEPDEELREDGVSTPGDGDGAQITAEPREEPVTAAPESQAAFNQRSADDSADAEVERPEDDVVMDPTEQKPDHQAEDIEEDPLDAQQTDHDQAGVEVGHLDVERAEMQNLRLDMNHAEEDQRDEGPTEAEQTATEQAAVSFKPPPLSLAQTQDEEGEEGEDSAPCTATTDASYNTTISVTLVSPSSERATCPLQQSPGGAQTTEEVKPSSLETETKEQNTGTQSSPGEDEPAGAREEENEEAVRLSRAAAPVEEDAKQSSSPPAAAEEETLQQPSSGSDQSRVRFTVTPAWQRSQSTEEGATKGPATPASPSSPPPCVSSIPSSAPSVARPGGVESGSTAKKDPPTKAELVSSVRAEVASSPGRPRSIGAKPQTGTAAATEECPVVVEGNPENPFGVRLRKTVVLHRYGSEEENTEPALEPKAQPTGSKVVPPQPPSVKPSLSPPISVKPALPKKPDVQGDSGVKTKRTPDAGSGSPSWISVARQKQRIYKDNSLDETTAKKEPERKSSLPLYVSSAACREHSKPPESTGKVSLLETSKPAEPVEKEGRRALSPPTPVPPQPPKPQLHPCPIAPKPSLQLSPAAPKQPPQPTPSQRALSPPTPVPVSQRPPSYTSSPSLHKSPLPHPVPSSKTPQPQGSSPAAQPASALASPPISPRTTLAQSGSLPSGSPRLSSPAQSPQRGLPTPGSPPQALPQDEPPWMALAKKKAKAWSEMPQIVQ